MSERETGRARRLAEQIHGHDEHGHSETCTTCARTVQLIEAALAAAEAEQARMLDDLLYRYTVVMQTTLAAIAASEARERAAREQAVKVAKAAGMARWELLEAMSRGLHDAGDVEGGAHLSILSAEAYPHKASAF